ncbi:uncharacterized protein LOC116964081 [Tyto alba]|uniref:uncharacterized protein LOC116964081 n=1 Tax=Tyto alba TaxID=56313 RepID=UPI001C667F4D|nr:uncharacterized protein LOC116964081 [Tyto alba]
MSEPVASSPSLNQSSSSSPRHVCGGGGCGEWVPPRWDWAGAEQLSPEHPALAGQRDPWSATPSQWPPDVTSQLLAARSPLPHEKAALPLATEPRSLRRREQSEQDGSREASAAIGSFWALRPSGQPRCHMASQGHYRSCQTKEGARELSGWQSDAASDGAEAMEAEPVAGREEAVEVDPLPAAPAGYRGAAASEEGSPPRREGLAPPETPSAWARLLGRAQRAGRRPCCGDRPWQMRTRRWARLSPAEFAEEGGSKPPRDVSSHLSSSNKPVLTSAFVTFSGE